MAALTELFGFPPSGSISPSVRLLEKDYSFYDVGANFSKTALIGFASKGPINEPTRVYNHEDLYRKFGLPHPEADHGSYLLYAAIEFLKYGVEAWIVRVGVTDETDWDNFAKTAYVEIPASGKAPILRSRKNSTAPAPVSVVIEENINDKFRVIINGIPFKRLITIPAGTYDLISGGANSSLIETFNTQFTDDDGIEAFEYTETGAPRADIAFRTTKLFGPSASIELVSVEDAIYDTIGLGSSMESAEIIGDPADSGDFVFSNIDLNDDLTLIIRVDGTSNSNIDNVEQTIPFGDLAHIHNSSSITPSGANGGLDFEGPGQIDAETIAKYINWFIDNPTLHSYTVPGGFRADETYASTHNAIRLYTVKKHGVSLDEISGSSALIQVKFISKYVDDILYLPPEAKTGYSGSLIEATDGFISGADDSGETPPRYIDEVSGVTGSNYAAGTAPTIMTIWADSPGIEGNDTKVVVDINEEGKIALYIYTENTSVETHGGLDRDYLTVNNIYYIERWINGFSDYIYIEDETDIIGLPAEGTYSLGATVDTQGSDGYPYDTNGIPDADKIDDIVVGNEFLGTGLYSLAEPERIDIDLVAAPGLTSTQVIVSLIELAQTSRRDCMAIIDPPFGLDTVPIRKWHNGEHQLNTIKLDSSYAALYWPWVQINDSFNKLNIWVPPSGSVLGVYAKTESQAAPWFAPAGLRRGTIPSVSTVEKFAYLKERDTLYGNRNAVNVLVPFPIEGVTVWGNKTLQRRASALDRVNVRRLMLYVEKTIRSDARFLLFEPHTELLRDRFISIANRILDDVVSRQGITDYRVKCDEELNTPEVIDRNELRAKIGIQPVKAAEFIFIEFSLHRTGTFEESII